MSHTGEAGYSLLEMLIVLAILALAAAFLVPRAGVGTEGVRADLAARRILGEAAGLRAKAIRDNRAQTLALARDGRAIVTSRGTRLELPDGATAVVEPSIIRFLPDGRSSGGRVHIRGRTRGIAIDIDWLTGMARQSKEAS